VVGTLEFWRDGVVDPRSGVDCVSANFRSMCLVASSTAIYSFDREREKERVHACSRASWRREREN
jgi:hypothetical protein